MHIFEVTNLEEQSIAGLPGWSLTRDRRRWVARDPDGVVRASGRVRGNVEANAKDYAQRASTRTTPSQTTDEPTQRRNRNPRRDVVVTRDPIVADPDERSARNRGDSERGRKPTRIEPSLIATRDTDDAAIRRAAGEIDPDGEIRRSMRPNQTTNTDTPDDDRPASRDRNPKPARAGIIRRFMARLASIGGGTIGTIVNAALTAVEVEEELDRMLRVVQSEIERQENEGVAPEDVTWTDAMEAQYRETINDLVELTFKGIVALLATASASSLIVVALASIIGTGGTSIILGLIAGGIIGFFGTEALYQVLEWAGVMDMVEDFIAKEWLTPSVILSLAAGVDVIQNMPLVPGDDPTSIGSEDDLTDVMASTDHSSKNAIIESGKPNEKEVVNKLRDMITGNPELLAIYNKGKAKAKATKAALDQR